MASHTPLNEASFDFLDYNLNSKTKFPASQTQNSYSLSSFQADTLLRSNIGSITYEVLDYDGSQAESWASDRPLHARSEAATASQNVSYSASIQGLHELNYELLGPAPPTHMFSEAVPEVLNGLGQLSRQALPQEGQSVAGKIAGKNSGPTYLAALNAHKAISPELSAPKSQQTSAELRMRQPESRITKRVENQPLISQLSFAR
jgi:hypothetical protein